MDLSRHTPTLRALALAALTAGTAAAADGNAPVTRPGEVICGFVSGPHSYLEASSIRRGLDVELFVGDAKVDRPLTLRFFVNEKPKGFPEERLQVEHEKFVHVIGIRDDLAGFFHLHPVKVAPGQWEVTYTFPKGGNYKIWSDVKFRGTSYSFGHPAMVVTGVIGEGPGPREIRDDATVEGYKVSVSHGGPLATGCTNQLQFAICDAAGKPVQTENYLGGPMHVVFVSEDLSVYLHAHPENHAAGNAGIGIRQIFPKAGVYKMIAEFRPREAKLAPDTALEAEFWMNVAASQNP
jgi:hypothetical protein